MKIAMLILAAGFSQRMGALKPLLPVGETSALCRAISLGRHEKIHSISVVTGHRSDEVEAELLHCRAKNVRHIHNAHYADGMLTSVKAGIHSLPGDIDGFFLLPVDHCAVKAETLEKLIASFILAEGQQIIYPTYKGERGHPPLIPYSFAAGVKSYDGTDGMGGYLAQLASCDVELDDPGMLLDMDTPDDYAALLRYLGYPTYPDEDRCLRLLDKYEVPGHIISHSRQVGSTAAAIADRLIAQGVAVDKPLLQAACLLHDIARLEPDHENAGAQLLLSEGYPDAARLVRRHMDLPEDAMTEAPIELLLLYLADKLCRDGRIVPLEETLAQLESRYSGEPDALAGARRRLHRAMAIQELLERRYGIRAGEIPAE